MSALYQYPVRYRRDEVRNRIHRMTVVAATADEARRLVAIRDPEFSHTVASPKRGRMVVATDDDYQPESADGIRRLADSFRPTLREERDEMLADRELMADEMHGRTW